MVLLNKRKTTSKLYIFFQNYLNGKYIMRLYYF
jgi:hypothetical protein